MRALVTGSAGFIGRHLVEALRRRGDEVVGCDPKCDVGGVIVLPGREWTVHMVGDFPGDCRQFFRDWTTQRFDVVFHCAATVGGREGIDHNAAYLAAYNLQLDGALFEWALTARPGRIVYFSSSAAYPVRLQNGHRDSLFEAHGDYVGAGGPDATYGWVKLTGERIATEIRKAAVPVTIVRPFSGYGEDQDDCYPFPAFIQRAKRRDDPFDVWGDGQQVRDWIHVDDLTAALLALVDAGVDGPVNLGTGVGTSMDNLARLCMREAGYDAPIRHLADKPTGVRHRVADITLLRRYYEPRVSIEEGVRRALA